jgi:hypothetical protein
MSKIGGVVSMAGDEDTIVTRSDICVMVSCCLYVTTVLYCVHGTTSPLTSPTPRNSGYETPV